MTLFTIADELCLRDGICVAECPGYYIVMKNDGSCPTPATGAETGCIHCGHCVAVCPTGALSQANLSAAQCQAVEPGRLPDAAQVEHMLRSRRSIRAFTDQPVSQDTLIRLLNTAACAPSASNSQPVEWLVIHDTAVVRRLGLMILDWLRRQPASPRYARLFEHAHAHGLDLVCRGAPHMVIALTPAGGQTDGVIALTYLELAAYGQGLGACWCGFANLAINGSSEIGEIVALPSGWESSGVMLLGYPRYIYARVPPRNPARIQWA
jgi:nitroreductase/NAD-dependent dihydropyrimidine dehydrogenase PreA subunit